MEYLILGPAWAVISTVVGALWLSVWLQFRLHRRAIRGLEACQRAIAEAPTPDLGSELDALEASPPKTRSVLPEHLKVHEARLALKRRVVLERTIAERNKLRTALARAKEELGQARAECVELKKGQVELLSTELSEDTARCACCVL